MDADYLNKISRSDEINFHLDDFVNRQNVSNKSSENSQVICGYWDGEIISPFFFENAAGQAIMIGT
jgi:hypothetical protein